MRSLYLIALGCLGIANGFFDLGIGDGWKHLLEVSDSVWMLMEITTGMFAVILGASKLVNQE